MMRNNNSLHKGRIEFEVALWQTAQNWNSCWTDRQTHAKALNIYVQAIKWNEISHKFIILNERRRRKTTWNSVAHNVNMHHASTQQAHTHVTHLHITHSMIAWNLPKPILLYINYEIYSKRKVWKWQKNDEKNNSKYT